MKESLYRHGTCLALIMLAASLVIAQDTPIRSVRVTVAPKTRGASAIIRNLHDSPLMAWRIETTPPSVSTHSCLGDLMRVPNLGPINPREPRTLSLPSVGGKGPVEARITAAVFADGYYEGAPAAVAFFLKERHDHAARFAFWLDAFDKLPSGTEQQRRTYLMAKIAESAGAAARFDTAGADLRRRLSNRPNEPISTLIDEYRPKIQAALRDTSAPARRAPDEASSLLTLEVVPSDRIEYVVRIENLRPNAAIEGWMVGLKRADGGSVQLFQGADASLNDPSGDLRPGPSGRILPRQSRSFDISLPRADRNARIELAMVLFDDLSFEGSAEARDRMLDQRERIAEDYAFWIEVYREVAALPATEAKAVLEARRSDRARQKASAGAGPDVALGGEAIGVLERSPLTFPSWLKRRLGEIEAAHARLTRRAAGTR